MLEEAGRSGTRANDVLTAAAVALVAVVAFTARLLPVLRGAGLYGLGDYDDAVHYGSAVALVHGQLPYHDFLFLQPPGIVLALSPFAALGLLVGDPNGFAAARLGWMLLGGVNALLVVRVLRRQGRAAMLLGGLFYALFPPAIYGEHSTQLEGLATTCILVALLLLTSPPDLTRLPAQHRGWVLLAGAALGVSTGIKIWGLAAVVIAAGWAWKAVNLRQAGTVIVGGAVGATAVCLPFFLAAPSTMYRMVVLDQLGRPQVKVYPTTRLSQIAGLPGHPHALTPLLIAVLVAFTTVVVLAALTPSARLAVALLGGLTLVLLVTPSWFVHYASLIAGPAAVTAGFGADQLIIRAGRFSPRLAIATALALGVLVAAYVPPGSSVQLGETFPGKSLAATVGTIAGCVTTDDPTTLIEMDVLSRNLDRGCPLVLDLGGRSYDEPTTGPPGARATNRRWQQTALAYLRGGSVTIIVRFTSGQGFSPATAATIKQWYVVRRIGRFVLRSANGPL